MWDLHEQVVKDIVLQETFHHISVASDDDKEESEVKVEEHVEQSLTGRGSHVFSSEEKLITYSSGPNESWRNNRGQKEKEK